MSKFYEVDNISGVYRISCVPENKAYIRSGRNMWWQFNHNFTHLRAGDHPNSSLQDAYRKYGLTAFTCDILEEAPINKCADAEFDWIKKFDPSSLYNEVHDPQIDQFVSYINNKWLVPFGSDEDAMKKYRIWREEDKREIALAAKRCFLLDAPASHITFVATMKFMSEELGYEIVTDQFMFNVSKLTYRLVAFYDPAASTYVPPYHAPSSTPNPNNKQ